MKEKLARKQNAILRVALAALLVWIVISLIQLQTEINAKQATLDDLHAQIVSQQRINDELAKENADNQEYLEQQARNKGLAKPGESIYKEVPGN